MTIEFGVGMAILAAVTGAFWRIWGLISEAREKGESAHKDLAAYKTHVAETYVTKAGMAEQTAQIMRAIDSVGAKIDRTNDRLDNLMQLKPAKDSN